MADDPKACPGRTPPHLFLPTAIELYERAACLSKLAAAALNATRDQQATQMYLSLVACVATAQEAPGRLLELVRMFDPAWAPPEDAGKVAAGAAASAVLTTPTPVLKTAMELAQQEVASLEMPTPDETKLVTNALIRGGMPARVAADCIHTYCQFDRVRAQMRLDQARLQWELGRIRDEGEEQQAVISKAVALALAVAAEVERRNTAPPAP